MNTSLFTLYTPEHDNKQSNAHYEKSVLSSDKRSFAPQAQAIVDYDYNGAYNADDDAADYMTSIKAVRIA
jgi:hypothetical protein